MITLTNYVTKAQVTIPSATLVIASLSSGPQDAHAASAVQASATARAAARAAKRAKFAKPAKGATPAVATPAPAAPAVSAPIPLRGTLSVYPASAMPAGGGLPTTPAIETVRFSIPDVTALPSGTNLLTQVYAALKLQKAYSAGTLS